MKKVLLCIMDGVGLREETKGNALKNANTKTIDRLMEEYPHTYLEASGEYVGLPNGQMGNSEVGHSTIGSGRIIYQSLEKINKSIREKDFYSNEELLNVIKEAKKRGLIKYKTSENVGKYGKYTFQFCLTYLPQVEQDRHRKIYLMPTNEWKQIKKAGVENDTYISDESDTYEKQKTDKMGNPISVESDTTIYILGDTYKNEREVVNE